MTCEVQTPPIILGDKTYKYFQPCQCDCCPQARPAHICIYQEGIGIICDCCQRDRGIAHLNPEL